MVFFYLFKTMSSVGTFELGGIIVHDEGYEVVIVHLKWALGLQCKVVH